MSNDRQNLHKLKKEVTLLESELAAIKGSRAYRLSRVLGVIKTKVQDNPVGTARKATRLFLNNPRQMLAFLKGGQVNTQLHDVLENRLIQYHRWIALHEPSEDELIEQRRASQEFAYRPTISILTPVFNPPVDVLESLIESVLGQTYPYFHLCLGNFGDSPQVKELLAKYAAEDGRIKVTTHSENLGIAGNSNQILETVTGEFIALLDHDDTLSPDALYENVKLLNETEYDFIYSDKDMIDEVGNRFDPLFKPDWSPEIMLSANYLTHLNVMRTSVVREVGGWDEDTNGAQDWDIFLKVISKTTRPIGHISKVLYHWRVIATSTAHSIDTKPYALAGQRQAIQKYLDAKHIAAKPHHHKTEVLLDWAPTALDERPLVVIASHVISDTMRLVTRLKQAAPSEALLVVMHTAPLDDRTQELLRRQGVGHFLHYVTGELGGALDKLRANQALTEGRQALVLVDDSVQLPKAFSYADLTGFLSVPEVGAVGGKILNHENLILDAGALLGDEGLRPLFHAFPSYYNAYLGNAEWVRNLRLVSRHLVAIRLDALKASDFEFELSDETVVAGLLISLSRTHRLVYHPKVVGYRGTEVYTAADEALLPLIAETLQGQPDSYGNRNLSPHNPMQLDLGDNLEEAGGSEPDTYQNEALILSRAFDLTADQIAQNLAITSRLDPLKPRTAGFILPGFDARYAGLTNIFSFAAYLARQQHLRVTFVILKGGNEVDPERTIIVDKYPELAEATFVIATPDSILEKMPKLDIGICTQWATAYMLAKAPVIGRKCYFIQDYEPNFYPKGSVSALAEETYKLGFFALANTPGLLELYHERYNGPGVLLKSLVDLSDYHPNEDRLAAPHKPYRVFFYARPNMPRNAFELGLAGLQKLKQELGDNVEIIAAGAEWEPAAYGVEGVVRNLGKIRYEEVPPLYRSVHAGMMFMFSGHPGVTASELMASGCPVVVNDYDDSTWHDLYRDGETCLVTVPTASEIARNLRRCLEDNQLRQTLIEGGLKKVQEYYRGYDQSLDKAYAALIAGRSDV